MDCSCRICVLIKQNERLTAELVEANERRAQMEEKTNMLEDSYYRDQAEICTLKIKLSKHANIKEKQSDFISEQYDHLNGVLTEMREDKYDQYMRMITLIDDLKKISTNLSTDLSTMHHLLQRVAHAAVCKKIEDTTSGPNLPTIQSEYYMEELQEQVVKANLKIKLLEEQLKNKENTCKSLARTQAVKTVELQEIKNNIKLETIDLEKKVARLQMDLKHSREKLNAQEQRRKLEHSGFIQDFKDVRKHIKKLEKQNLLQREDKREFDEKLNHVKEKLKKT